jgi:hypothetical protein
MPWDWWWRAWGSRHAAACRCAPRRLRQSTARDCSDVKRRWLYVFFPLEDSYLCIALIQYLVQAMLVLFVVAGGCAAELGAPRRTLFQQVWQEELRCQRAAILRSCAACRLTSCWASHYLYDAEGARGPVTRRYLPSC